MNGCLKTSIRLAPNKLTFFLTCPITYPLTSIVVFDRNSDLLDRNFPCLGITVHEPRAGRYIACDIHILIFLMGMSSQYENLCFKHVYLQK